MAVNTSNSHHEDLTKKIEDLERLAAQTPVAAGCVVHMQDKLLPGNCPDIKMREGSYIFVKDTTVNPPVPNPNPIPALYFVNKDGTFEKVSAGNQATDLAKLKTALDDIMKTSDPANPSTMKRLTDRQIAQHITENGGHSPVGKTQPWTVQNGTTMDYKESPLAKFESEINAKLMASMDTSTAVLVGYPPIVGPVPAPEPLDNVIKDFKNDLNNLCEKAHELRKTADFLEPNRWEGASGVKAKIIERVKAFKERVATIDSTDSTAAANLVKVKTDLNANADEITGSKLDELAKEQAGWMVERLKRQNEILACMRQQANLKEQNNFSFFQNYQGDNRLIDENTETLGVGAYPVRTSGHAMANPDSFPAQIFKNNKGEEVLLQYDKDKKLYTASLFIEEGFWGKSHDLTDLGTLKKSVGASVDLLRQKGFDEIVMVTHDGAGVETGGVFGLSLFGLIKNKVFTRQMAFLEAVMEKQSKGAGPHMLSELPNPSDLAKFRNSYVITGSAGKYELHHIDQDGKAVKSALNSQQINDFIPRSYTGRIVDGSNDQSKVVTIKGRAEVPLTLNLDTNARMVMYQALKADPTMLDKGGKLFGNKGVPINESVRGQWVKQLENGAISRSEFEKLNAALDFNNFQARGAALTNTQAQVTSAANSPNPQSPTIAAGTALPAVEARDASMVHGDPDEVKDDKPVDDAMVAHEDTNAQEDEHKKEAAAVLSPEDIAVVTDDPDVPTQDGQQELKELEKKPSRYSP